LFSFRPLKHNCEGHVTGYSGEASRGRLRKRKVRRKKSRDRERERREKN
jgi:hypothetical protein